MANGPGTGWTEEYMGGSAEAERALFDEALSGIERIQETVARKQVVGIRRAFHNKGLPITMRFAVANDLPDHLRVGFLEPGASYPGFGRFSRSQSFRRRDADLDQRGFAFRIDTPLGPQDFLLSNTPVSFARDPVVFMTVASIFVGPLPLAPFRLAAALGIVDAVRVLANVLRPPDRTVAFTSQGYWSRTPFAFGDAAARLLVRPDAHAGRRVSNRRDPDFLTTDLVAELGRRAASFELCAQLFVDERQTPIEDSSHAWSEDVAPPIVLGRVILPVQDLAGSEARALADRVERSEAFSPWTTPCLRPLGRTNRARLEAYLRSATHRGALDLPGAGQQPGTMAPA
jgi:hypothetical protein